MAKVYGQDIPSKYFDTYHNFFARSFDQRHQPYGKSVKKSNWDFPGYPYHPHFPSPAQLYVRAIFKSATVCWHMQPDVGGNERPDAGPIPREWWEAEADKERTFGYRKFMRDTLLYKFRIGEPTWCEEIVLPATYVDWEYPDTNFCENKKILASYKYVNQWRCIYIARTPEDIGKEYLYLYAYHTFEHPVYRTYVDAVIPHWFEFDPCTLTYNTQPLEDFHISRNYVLDPGWYRFYVADFQIIKIRIYFSIWDIVEPDCKGQFYCHSSDSDILDLRPYFALD